MPWARVEDTAHSHPRVLLAGVGGDDRMTNEALGWLLRCAAYSAEHLTDGYLAEHVMALFGGARTPELLKACQRAGSIGKRKVTGPDGTKGYRLDDTADAVVHLRTREEVELDRARRGTTRKQDARNEVKLRDGDQCRYCAAWVDFRLRKGAHRGTWDHPDPADRDVFVVCCGDCNQRKGQRTPAEAGMTLLPVPDVKHYRPETRQALAALGLLPPLPDSQSDEPARSATQASSAATTARSTSQVSSAAPGSQPEAAAAVQIRTGSGPDPSTSALPRQPSPGRDGTGRDGTPRPPRGSRGSGARNRRRRPG